MLDLTGFFCLTSWEQARYTLTYAICAKWFSARRPEFKPKLLKNCINNSKKIVRIVVFSTDVSSAILNTQPNYGSFSTICKTRFLLTYWKDQGICMKAQAHSFFKAVKWIYSEPGQGNKNKLWPSRHFGKLQEGFRLFLERKAHENFRRDFSRKRFPIWCRRQKLWTIKEQMMNLLFVENTICSSPNVVRLKLDMIL